ncbi:DUF421 domain-containing protein [Tenuibacillus multivorans]|uniref:Uncharacterized membrane protein YcaP, DUF421 family n=1 Tax=Tenuibacillus multivorans TaxID=237069 RepID=A0A1H0ESU0_9BACI|nr:DUF421 domain-containing protein [Tenuibacillus multivorans]GEL76968.1 DUF421 domain-containing protein [Tenuibacillus multivorans]SDN85432.1 Uncharacterized membrane protein YcaP, DUF421 family [Tenuibacillus multivorans]
MEWDFIWKAILIVLGGTILLRIAGRKTISQMTLAETVLMIAIGSLLIQPISGRNIWMTLFVGGILVATLIVLEYVQLKSDGAETLITGKSKVLIENGTINEKNLAKVRMTVDQLEMNLRQKNVTNISDVQYATIEPNGQIGYTLKEDAQPVTKKEFQQLLQDMSANQTQLAQLNQQLSKINQDNMFTEVSQNEHAQNPPEHLQ